MPQANSIEWIAADSLEVSPSEATPILFVLEGITYEIASGFTNLRYVYFDTSIPAVSPEGLYHFQTTDNLLDCIGDTKWYLCKNENGIPYWVDPVKLGESDPQELGIGASPTFVNLTLTGLSPSSLVVTDVNKQLDSVVLGNGVGFISGILGILPSEIDHDQLLNVHQNVNTIASPQFVDLTLNGVNPLSLIASDLNKKLVPVVLGDGLSFGVSPEDALNIIPSEIDHDQLLNVHQDVNIDASPFFANLGIGISPTVPLHIYRNASNNTPYTQLWIVPIGDIAHKGSAVGLVTKFLGTNRWWYFGAGEGGAPTNNNFRIVDCGVSGAGPNLDRITIDISGNIGFNQKIFGANATQVLALSTGVAPTTSPINAFQMYSADFAVGQACPHFRTEDGIIIKLNQDVATTASPVFIDLVLTGLSPLSLIATDIDSKLESLVLGNGLGFISGIFGIIPSEIDHDSLLGFVANEHINHSGVSISPGTGMSGGGDLTTTRTLICTITQYTDALARTACIASSISDGDLTHSPDGNSVFDAFVLKAPIASPTFTGTLTTPTALISGLTASEIVGTDASKNLTSLAIATYPSLTELSYVKGVSSALQTQLGLKAPLISPSFTTPTLGVALATSISIDGHVLDSNEWHYLDGQNQAVLTTSAPTFVGLTVAKTVTANTGGINSTTLTIDNTFGGTYANAGIYVAKNTGNVGVSNNLTGFNCTVWQDGSGTLAIARGATFNVYNTHATGVITQARTLEVNEPYFSSTGTIGTLYGLYIAAQAHAQVTTPYGIYQSGASDRNYFAGKVGIGVDPALARLHIDQSSTTGAIPVLTLDQGDVSEEFIRFIGTAADNVLTQTIVAAADVANATLAGYVKVYVQDDGNQIADQAYYMPVYTLT